MNASVQLALPFAERPDYAAADFIEAATNAEARGWLGRPGEWPERRLALWGEAGVGKSHLLQVWARRHGAPVLEGPLLAAADPPGAGALALDNADLFAAELPLLNLLNLAAEAGAFLLLAGRTQPARWMVKLPDLASRLAASAAVMVGAPDEALREALFTRLLSARQLVVAPALTGWLLTRLPRHPAALLEAAARLDRAGLSAGRALSRALAAEALAPLFSAETADEDAISASPPAPRLL